jgi:hypothetical protein
VGLQIDEAKDYLRAGLLQPSCPVYIALFIEPRLQFNQRGYRFTGFRGIDEGRDDRRIFRCPVERLLDRDDVRVARRLTEELHNYIERLIRMMDNNVFSPDGCKAVPAVILDPLGKARRKRREQ